jgi:hypothetical protein
VTRRIPAGPARIVPGNPDAPQPGHGVLDHAHQGPGFQIEEPLERAQIPAGLLDERGAYLSPLGTQSEGVLIVQQTAHEVRPPGVGKKGIGLQRQLLPQPPEGPGHRHPVGPLDRQKPQQSQEVLRGRRQQDPAQRRQPAGAQQQPAYLVTLHTDRHFSSDQPPAVGDKPFFA